MNLLIGAAFLAALIDVGIARARLSDQGLGLRDLQSEGQGFRFSRRQTSSGPAPLPPPPPPECKAICDPVDSALQTCTPSSCCTSTFETAFFGCFICIGGTAPTSNYTMVQGILDGFVRTCAAAGIQIPTLTFPGQDPNRPISGVPGNSSTASGPTTPNPSFPSAGAGSTTTSASLIITTDLGPPQQTTITSLPTTTGPNAPTDTAFTPPSNSGWRMMTGQWWAGMTILTVGSLLGGFLIF